ncbi:MAG TPA: DUF4124 domain-containing protein [Chromatiales bacterium]|nr:DUF4124 domain-containing protein [Chromatiales bacterium]
MAKPRWEMWLLRSGRVLVFFLCGFQTPRDAVGGDVYRCTTAEGYIEFSQRPCGSADQRRVEIEDYRIGSVQPREIKRERTVGKKRRKAHRPKRASARGSERGCWKKKAQLERLEWRMRRGYKASRSADLHNKREVYEEYLRKFCRYD